MSVCEPFGQRSVLFFANKVSQLQRLLRRERPNSGKGSEIFNQRHIVMQGRPVTSLIATVDIENEHGSALERLDSGNNVTSIAMEAYEMLKKP